MRELIISILVYQKKHVYLYFITISQLTFNMHIHLIEKLSLSWRTKWYF